MVLAYGYAGAQTDGEDDHISWQFSSLKQSGSEWKLLFTAVLDPGWHLYSQSTPAGGPMAVRFDFSKPHGYRLAGGVKEAGVLKSGYDEVFMMDVSWYENNVIFMQAVKMAGKGSRSKVTGEISYSVCSGEMCTPGSVRFDLDVGN
jgi:DsbC/DsbD-like thiol-disulfide interchange protein